MKGLVGVRVLKSAIGATLAMLIASFFGLKFYTAAGIISILSVQSTKRQSVEIAVKRFGASVLALILASVSFQLLGFTPIVFGVFLVVFISLAARFKMGEGIVPSAVLVTHLLTEQEITMALLTNEMLLVIVGIGVALLVNLYMPSIEGKLHHYRKQIEEDFYILFQVIATGLERHELPEQIDVLFERIDATLRIAKAEAYRHSNNQMFGEASLYERYFDMRRGQYEVLVTMKRYFRHFFRRFHATTAVAELTRQVAESVKGHRLSGELLETLQEVRESFRVSELPTTREEFENRAMLYQFINELERFLEIKKAFRDGLSPEELLSYTDGYEE